LCWFLGGSRVSLPTGFPPPAVKPCFPVIPFFQLLGTPFTQDPLLGDAFFFLTSAHRFLRVRFFPGPLVWRVFFGADFCSFSQGPCTSKLAFPFPRLCLDSVIGRNPPFFFSYWTGPGDGGDRISRDFQRLILFRTPLGLISPICWVVRQCTGCVFLAWAPLLE